MGRGDKEISKCTPLLLKGGSPRNCLRGGGPPSKCKKSALHNIFQVTFWSSQWPPCQIAWSLFSPLICHTWLFFRQRFESFANDSVTFRLHVTEDSICSDLASLPTLPCVPYANDIVWPLWPFSSNYCVVVLPEMTTKQTQILLLLLFLFLFFVIRQAPMTIGMI